MKNIIKVKCIEDATFHKNDKEKTVIAIVKENEEYIAKLYRPTEEYFAEDSEGREFLVGQVRNDDDVNVVDGFKLI